MLLAWTFLALAISFEILGTTCLKMSEGLTRPIPSVVMVISYLSCFSLLGLALKKIDVSIAYAIWSGIGTAVIACIGFWYFKEAFTPLKLISIGLIILGVVGLNLSGLSR